VGAGKGEEVMEGVQIFQGCYWEVCGEPVGQHRTNKKKKKGMECKIKDPSIAGNKMGGGKY